MPTAVQSYFSQYLKPPFLPGFTYRKKITITAGSNGMPSDYQVKLVVDTASLISAGKMRSDCGDIRFTKADGVTLLSYWIESGVNTSQTIIWVKDADALNPNESHSIYMYYGNPSATSMSNGDNVFLFFDDFPGTSLDPNKWTVVVSTGGTATVSNSILTIASVSDGATWKAYGIKSGVALTTLHEVIAKVKWTYASEHESYILDKYADENNFQGMRYAGYYDYYGLRAKIAGTEYDTNYTLSNDNPAYFEWWKLRFDGSYERIFRSTDDITWTQLASRNTNIFTSGFNVGIREYVKGSTTNYFYIDYVFAKKYVEPEPTVGIGLEEVVYRYPDTM